MEGPRPGLTLPEAVQSDDPCNKIHRWYYVPQLRTDEPLLIKCYDSKTDGRARFVAHTAFNDPTTPAGAPPRESIELRTLVFHPD